MLTEHWEQWDAGDRKGSLTKIPDSLVDDLVVNGTPDECAAHIQRYVDNGITTPALMILPFGGLDTREAARALAPRRAG
jgi:alkanesulfonate monooxygenase SsuD/methylene tetrahydromethanopterin reductase-like flavin-dependent oxidoreductase (luciferase family)